MEYVKHENTWPWGRSIYIILSDGTGLVMVQLYDDEPEVGYINNLSVYINNRRKGIGKFLLHEAEKIAKENNISKIKLHCEKNSFAKDWYIREGYKNTGKIFIGEYASALELEKDI